MIGPLARLAKPFLLALDPERAHELTLRALELGVYPRCGSAPDGALATSVWGLRFPNPVGIAAGFDKDARVPDAVLGLGCGFAEVGTTTPLPQAGNPAPRVFRLLADRAVINRLGFNNAGHAAALGRLKARAQRGVVGVNIGANRESPDRVGDYVAGIGAFYDVASYFTVNISSPNTPGLRDLQAREPLRRLLGELLSARTGFASPRKPLFLKIAPDLDEAGEEAIAEVALALGIDGLIVSNTTITRPPGLRSPQRDEAGGLSGRPLMAPSTALLARMRRRLGPAMPLVGVGGIATGADVAAKLHAGATAVQLYTALVYRGLGLLPRLLAELEVAGDAPLASPVT